MDIARGIVRTLASLHHFNKSAATESSCRQIGPFLKWTEVVSTKPSEPDKVDAYMKKLKHPLADVVEALRRVILKPNGEIGEEIKWNAPTLFHTGEMKPFNHKEYKR